METSKCSAQLRRLVGRGVVSDEGGTHRRKQYYVSERLYNIYYLLRRSRGMDSLVGALVQFMDAYYSRSELEGIVDEMVGELGGVDPGTRRIYQAALERLANLPELAWHVYRKHPDHVPDDLRTVTEDAAALLARGGDKLEKGDLRGALVDLEDLLEKYRSQTTPTVQYSVLSALVNRGVILVHLHRYEEAMAACDEAAELFEASDSPDLRGAAATALLNKSYLLTRVGRTQDAIDVCDRLIERIPCDGSDRVAALVATAYLNRADMLDEMGRAEDALAAYDELQNRFGSGEREDVLVPVANGQVNKAVTLFKLQRWDEALGACEEVTGRFGNHASPRVLQPVWRAVTITSMVLSLQGRTREHFSACQELLNRLERHDERVAAGEVADYDADAVLTLRLVTHGIRVLAYIKDGNLAAVTADVREILRTVPRLSAVPAGTIQTLMAASIALGIDRMASLIRQSPSADHLLPLATALELEMGKEPRVAIEVQKVAEDMRRELAEVREHLSSKEVDES